MIRPKQMVFGVVLGAAAMPAVALTVDELMVEMQKMAARHQQEVRALQSELDLLQTQSAPHSSSTVTQRVAALETALTEVDKKSKKRDELVRRTLEEQKEKLQVHGFMSAYVVNADKNVDFSAIGLDDDEQFRSDTMAGVQFDYRVNDSVDAVLQLTANGYEDYAIDAEWAFLRFKVADGWMVRAGRLRAPFYMYSESMDVGYTYPWVRPPMESYLVGLNNYSGVDTLYAFTSGGWRHEVQFGVGTMDETVQGLGIQVRDLWAMALTSSVGAWTLRASYSGVPEVVFDMPGLGEQVPVGFGYASLGMRYDDGQWLALTEVVDVQADDDTFWVGGTSAYATLGYRVGKFMPYASFAVLTSGEDDEDRAYDFYDGLAGGMLSQAGFSKRDLMSGMAGAGMEVMQESKSITLGMRYELLDSVALKLESTYYYDMNGTLGVFDAYPGVTGVDQARAELGDSNQIVSFGVDSVF